MDYRFTGRKARNIQEDMGYIAGYLEGAVLDLERDNHGPLEFLRDHLLGFVEGYSNGKFVYKHSGYFNPHIAQILHEKIGDTLRDGSTKVEDVRRLIKFTENLGRIA